MVQRKALIGIATFLACLVAGTSWSHPHVFFTTSVDVVFDDKGLSGFEMTWVFDEMFSNMIILDFDANGNKTLEDPEAKKLEQTYFANLRKFNYFTHIKINGTPFKVDYVKDFSASIQDGQLTYRFFVPCHVAANASFKTIRLSVYDQTFYCSVFLKDDPVSYANSETMVVDHSIHANRDEAYYFGQVVPDEIALRFKNKNG